MRWKEPTIAELKVDCVIDSEGNFIIGEETVAGVKTVSIKGFNASGSCDDAQDFFTTVLEELVGITFDSYSMVYSVQKEVID